MFNFYNGVMDFSFLHNMQIDYFYTRSHEKLRIEFIVGGLLDLSVNTSLFCLKYSPMDIFIIAKMLMKSGLHYPQKL